MRVSVELQQQIKEPYAVIYAQQITEEVSRMVNFIGNEAGREKVLCLEQETGYVMVRMEEIYMVRFEEDMVVLYGEEEKYFSGQRLYQVEEQLDSDFIRISKTTIVSIRYMKSVEPSFGGTMILKMKNGLRDYISRKYLPEFKKKIGL